MKYLVVDAMMSGTGLRDLYDGGYIVLADLGLSQGLIDDFGQWLVDYSQARFGQFSDTRVIEHLDSTGIELSKRVMAEVPDTKVDYFSDALCRKLHFRAET